jgi:DNA polymerase-3 subunit alpha
MRQADFVHLHVHSVYSLLQSTIRLPQLLERARSYRLPALALTDHGNLFGAIEFYDQAYALGIKPIFGCELGVDEGEAAEGGEMRSPRRANHMVILAKNQRGYGNLIRLLTLAHSKRWQGEPSVPRSLLLDHHQGLILLSGCDRGDIAGCLLAEDREQAQIRASRYLEVFGRDRFFIEVQPSLTKEQRRLNGALVDLARAMALQVVATANSHLLDPNDEEVLRILAALRQGLTLEEVGPVPTLPFPSPEAMKTEFSHLPDAIANTLTIAERCNVDLELGKIRLPRFSLPRGQDAQRELAEQTRTGLRERLQQGTAPPPRYSQRLDRELDAIERLALADYFLIVADFVRFARANGIPVGPGSGAACMSLIAYALGISDIDPVEHGLLFEHLVNPLRPETPDLDLGFAADGRDEVYHHLTRTYGAERVAHIVSLGKMQARSALRDLARVFSLPAEEGEQVDPGESSAPPLSRERLLRLEAALEGLPRHVGTHGTGVVIGDGPLGETVPLFRDSRGEWVSQFDMRALKRVGLVKFDFLASKTLAVVARTLKLGGSNLQIPAASDRFPWKDRAAFHLLAEGKTVGIPHLDTETGRLLLETQKPGNWYDLLAAMAIHRLETGVPDRLPGARGHDGGAARTQEASDRSGLFLFDVDVTRFIAKATGWSLDRADLARRALARYGDEEREELRQEFLVSAQARGHSTDEAEGMWSRLERGTPLAPSKSGLVGRAYLVLLAAAVKARAPQEFTAALLSSDLGQQELLAEHVQACRAEGFKVFPPNINESEVECTVEAEDLRLGLAAIRHVSKTAAEAVVRARREGGAFRSLADLCARVGRDFLGRRAIESLIKAGALDSVEGGRKRLLGLLPEVMDEARSGQMGLFGGASEERPAAGHSGSDAEWSDLERLTHEKEALGFAFGTSRLAGYQALLDQVAPGGTAGIRRLHEGARARAGGLIRSVRASRSRKNEPLHFVEIEDFSGLLEVVVFADTLGGFRHGLERDVAVLAIGRVAREGDRVRLVADELSLLDEAALSLATSVHLHIRGEGLQREKLEKMARVLRAHPGPCPLFLHLHLGPQAEVVQKLPGTLAVRPEPGLEQDVRKEAGDVRLEVRYRESA